MECLDTRIHSKRSEIFGVIFFIQKTCRTNGFGIRELTSIAAFFPAAQNTTS